jgi:hypothetical protein
MSIAQNEAEERYPLLVPVADRSELDEGEVPNYDLECQNADIRSEQDAYVAGRTAEPSEAEIAAMSKRLYGLYRQAIARLLGKDEKGLPGAWDDALVETYRDEAKEALMHMREIVGKD